MGGSRRRLKKTQKVVRVGLPKRKQAKPIPTTLPGSQDSLEWNEKATLVKNYSSLGFALDPNYKGGRNKQTNEQIGEEITENGETVELKEDDEMREALGKKKLTRPSKPLQRLTKMQRVYMTALLSKHGVDFQAMSKDLKLNKMQHPPGALQMLFRRFVAYSKSELAPPN